MTSTVPAVPAGEAATQVVLDEQVTVAAELEPKETDVVPGDVEKLLPVMVTWVPPDVEPEVGEMDVTVGDEGTALPSGETVMLHEHWVLSTVRLKVPVSV
jgi:hypothetical protein